MGVWKGVVVVVAIVVVVVVVAMVVVVAVVVVVMVAMVVVVVVVMVEKEEEEEWINPRILCLLGTLPPYHTPNLSRQMLYHWATPPTGPYHQPGSLR